MGRMSYIIKYRWYLIGLLALIAIGYGVHRYEVTRPGPITTEVSTFQSGNFSITYPRIYTAKEYAAGVVSLGSNYSKTLFIPLVDVVRYKQDPQAATPASFTSFMNKQVVALCGTDAGIESVSCSAPVAKPYTNAAGLKGQEIMLTLNKKNLKTGTTSAATYGPVYVFETTLPATATSPVNYQGVFVYPTFSSFILVGTTSPAFVESIASGLTISK
jgi:hypothetical protein